MHHLAPHDSYTEASDKPAPSSRGWRTARQYVTDPDTWSTVGVVTTALALLGGLAYGVVWLITGAVNLISGGATAAHSGLGSATDVITNPVHTYLNANAEHIGA